MLFHAEIKLAVWTAVAKFLCQNQSFSTQSPKTKITWKVYGNKCSKHSSGHECCSFDNPVEIFKPLSKVQQKITHNPKKTIPTLFSTKPSFPQFSSMDISNAVFATLLIFLCQNNWSFLNSKSKED